MLCHFRSSVVLLLATVLCGPAFAQVHSTEIKTGWQFRETPATTTQPSSGNGLAADWQSATVPGDAQLDLLDHKLIPDQFYRKNETQLGWAGSASWQYRTKLEVSQAVADQDHVDLVFEGIDGYATVHLNGHQILLSNNMFRIWRVDVKPFLKVGANDLELDFPPPYKISREIADKDPWFSRMRIDSKTYVRKAAFEFGWDWSPSLIVSGIWRPVRLESWSGARISDVQLKQTDVTAAVAHVTAHVEIEASKTAEETIRIEVSNPKSKAPNQTITQTVQVHPGTNLLDLPLQITNPKLWWPAGYGEQNRYVFKTTVSHGKAVEDQKTTITGIRSLELRRKLDQWGRSFEFVVNGVPIFAKGSDLVPFDSLPNRVTPAKHRQILQSAKDANMNIIRVWGGGYYQTDEFYETCDELGLMIWHDFMFGNDWLPGTYDFKLNVEQEATDQIRRLRNHPSIVLWSGNNETEWAFHFGDRDKLDPAVRLKMWQDYISTFHGVLARTVAKLDPDVPYWPSSPSADLEETSENYQSGDDHLWDVWMRDVPFSGYEQHHPRFASEYGFASFPEVNTIKTFTLPEDRSISSDVMLSHQKYPEGNSIIQSYMVRDYGTAKDFSSFVYMSQVQQAEGVKVAAEHFRRSRPETMGSIFWQLNDCWPVISYSSIDYLGRWKALQFYARRFYAPVLASPSVKDGNLNVNIVSDRTVSKAGQLAVAIRGFDGTAVFEKSVQVTVTPLASSVAFEMSKAEIAKITKGDAARVFVSAELTIPGEETSRNLIYLVPTKEIDLPSPHLEMTLSSGSKGMQLRLHSDSIARSVYVSTDEDSAEFEDNFFDLLPGETRTISVRSDLKEDALRSQLHVMSVADAFQPRVKAPVQGTY